MYEGNLAVELIAEATADSDIAGVGQVLITVRMENPVSGFGQFAIVHGVVTQDIDDKHVEVELALSDILQALIVPHTSITTHMKGRIGCCYQSLIPCPGLLTNLLCPRSAARREWTRLCPRLPDVVPEGHACRLRWSTGYRRVRWLPRPL